MDSPGAFTGLVVALVVWTCVAAQETERPLAKPVKVDELDWCWYECVEYGELFCQEQDPPDNPFGNRKLSQFSLGREFSNPLPGSARNTGSTRTGFQSKPIDEYTFEEKCNSVYECRQIEGSGVPCGWCQTGEEFDAGFGSTCRKDGKGNCYPREQCLGVWTWQHFYCPQSNEFGCDQKCEYFMKKCVSSDFDQIPENNVEIVNEDFKYFPKWVNGR